LHGRLNKERFNRVKRPLFLFPQWRLLRGGFVIAGYERPSLTGRQQQFVWPSSPNKKLQVFQPHLDFIPRRTVVSVTTNLTAAIGARRKAAKRYRQRLAH